MALRIACDLDGTLADMTSALQREAERLFGSGVDLRARVVVPRDDEAEGQPAEGNPSPAGVEAEPQGGAPARRPLTDREFTRLWACVRATENFWMTLDEIEPGAVGQLAALARTHGWEVLFLTQRPGTQGETAQRQSQRWLQAHGFDCPAVFVMNGSRGKVAEALGLDVVVDDRPENCLDVATDSRARPILVWRDDPSTVPAATARFGITVVHSFAEALDALVAMMPAPADRPGWLARVRAAIGR
jgi:hypothetical protein